METPEINHENVKSGLSSCLTIFENLNPLERVKLFQELRGCLQATHCSTIQSVNEDLERTNDYRNNLNSFSFEESAVKGN